MGGLESWDSLLHQSCNCKHIPYCGSPRTLGGPPRKYKAE